jgi:uncharacterized protein (TIGR04222 family)
MTRSRTNPDPRPAHRRIAGGALVLLFSGALVFAAAAAATAQEEAIRSYDVRMQVQTDGSMLVTERIDYDFDSTEHHGISRDIPSRLTYDDRYDRVYPIDVVSVTASPGTPDQYETSQSGTIFEIKIGDPDRTVTGEHTYTITYRVQGAVNHFSNHDELYWNVTGNQWPVPIEQARATVAIPGDVQRVACFAGEFGSSLSCDQADFQGETATFAASNLGVYQGMSVVVGFPTGLVSHTGPILKERWSIGRAFELTPATGGASVLLLAALLFGVGWLGWRTGRDRRAVGSVVDQAYATPGQDEQPVPLFEHGATPVEYAPPDDIRPGQMGTLVDEVANPLDVSATVVDLAVRGYLKIEEIPKRGMFGKPDWKLILQKRDGSDLLPYERELADGLFEDGDEVLLSSLKRKFVARLTKVQNELYDDAVRRGWFTRRPDSVRAFWVRIGVFAIVVAGAIVYLAARFTHLGLIALALLIGAIALVASARRMPRRTPAGTGMVRRVFGFRTYIETAEAQEMRFQEKENIFSKYLPYAIVFGCTEKWAKAFEQLGLQPDTGSWYVGSHPFTALAFAGSIDHFSVAAVGTISSTPAGSGSSGFGGGGFSGGGGGGGGGGSW